VDGSEKAEEAAEYVKATPQLQERRLKKLQRLLKMLLPRLLNTLRKREAKLMMLLMNTPKKRHLK